MIILTNSFHLQVQFSDNKGPKSKFTPFLFSVSKAAITYYRFFIVLNS